MLWETSKPDQEKSHFINSFTDSLLDSSTQHLAEDVLAEQWNLSIYHVLGVCQQLHKGWETLNGKDTSPDLNFLMYGMRIQSADLSLSQRSLTPINLISQDSRKTMPPSYFCLCRGPCSGSSSALATGLCLQKLLLVCS